MLKAYSFSRFNDVVRLGEAQLQSDPASNVRVLIPLCGAYEKLKRYDRMLDCADRLERRIRAGERTHADSMIMPSDITPVPDWMHAAVKIDFEDYAGAIESARSALSKVNPQGGTKGILPPHAYSLELLPILAVASALSGDRAGAAAYLRQLEGIDIPYVGSALFANQKELAIARVDMALGEYGAALDRLGKEHGGFSLALGSLLVGSGDDDYKTLTALPRAMMKAKCLIELGRLDEARKVLDPLLANPRVADQSEVHWIALFERARIFERDGETDHAIELYRRAVEIIERQRSTIRSEVSKMGFVGDKQEAYHRVVATLVARDRIDDAFDFAERSKSRALVDLLAARKEFAVPEGERERVRAILDRMAAQDARAASIGGAPTRGAAGAEREAIRAVSPDLASLVTVTSVPLADLRATLQPGESLVEYYGRGDDLYAFVLTREGLRCVRLDGKNLVAKVRALRDAVQDLGGDGWRENARALYDSVWKPIEPLLTGMPVAVVAHGPLHYVPFTALADAQGAQVIDRHALRLLPSASVLRFIRPATARDTSLLVLGNPDLGDPQLDLAFAELEAREIARGASGARLLVRRDASETNFKRTAGAFSRIHLATHGKFQGDNPMSSGMYLAKDGENDGVLTVGELYSLALDADLVTLSACETGLGKVSSGDDVVGLTRGFLYAGSRSIVASLWEVDDRATGELMRRFYDNLATMPKQEALRRAQLAVRAQFAHPFFWAAFGLTGRGS